ncbi:hypothetical protein [Thermogemmata fonticola]|jgi:hypothetical protein|uniref:HEAT repeat domain-containing protein n=1 Tax=Thermogemmata fonticola TaxID=2755323 RepID=A0A7V8VFB1_9BACT|nr:hypothetical protein [Thermogemmata fonticola]MBA2226892.1 hypothetical protein [Thermogemmata fonticola]
MNWRYGALVLAGALALNLAGIGGLGRAASPDPKDLAVPPEVLSKARLLIQQLGSDSYREREQAQAELAKMGRLARPALLEAMDQHPNPEVRFRASLLLPRASAEDLKARLEAFLADTEARYEHALPGLSRFRKLVGTDVKARNLFAEFVKSPSNLELLTTLEQGDAAAGRAVADRRYLLFAQMQGQRILPNGQIIHEPRQVSFADIACLLFVEALVPSKYIPSTPVFGHVGGSMFLQQPASHAVLNNPSAAHHEAYRRLVGAWLASRDDPNEWNNLVHMLGPGGVLQNFPQAQVLLRRIANSDTVPGWSKAQALIHLVRRNGRAEIPTLLALFQDDTTITQVWFGNPGLPNQPPIQHELRLRDFALACMLYLTNQRLADYGFRFPPGQALPANQLSYGNYAFDSEQARQAAFVKFGFWLLKNGMPEANTPPTPPSGSGRETPPAPSVPPRIKVPPGGINPPPVIKPER